MASVWANPTSSLWRKKTFFPTSFARRRSPKGPLRPPPSGGRRALDVEKEPADCCFDEVMLRKIRLAISEGRLEHGVFHIVWKQIKDVADLFKRGDGYRLWVLVGWLVDCFLDCLVACWCPCLVTRGLQRVPECSRFHSIWVWLGLWNPQFNKRQLYKEDIIWIVDPRNPFVKTKLLENFLEPPNPRRVSSFFGGVSGSPGRAVCQQGPEKRSWSPAEGVSVAGWWAGCWVWITLDVLMEEVWMK